ncbi:sensor histidine kinase [Treponema sp.]|uniref:sensor histidine kinase n=1 Tax=Treponema sp. TaxID=166 RepID=UPI00298DCF06|nr:sensor histidine kinase [Treponema sp.]MCQ2241700.1 sensor histidine kinase [Treponema sp.]
MRLNRFKKTAFLLLGIFVCPRLFAKEMNFICHQPGIQRAATGRYTCDDEGKIFYHKNNGEILDFFELASPADSNPDTRLVRVAAYRGIKDLLNNNFYDFDVHGNLYFVASADFHPRFAFDDIKSVTYIYRFNPVDESISYFRMNENSAPNSFCVSGDGRWILLDTMELTDIYRESYSSRVYLISASFDSDPIPVYSSGSTDYINHLLVNTCFWENRNSFYFFTTDGKLYSLNLDAVFSGKPDYSSLVLVGEYEAAYKIYANNEGLWGLYFDSKDSRLSHIVRLADPQGNFLDANESTVKEKVKGNWKLNPQILVEPDSILFINEKGSKIYEYSNSMIQNVTEYASSKNEYDVEDLETVSSVMAVKENGNLKIRRLKQRTVLLSVLLAIFAVIIIALTVYVLYLTNRNNRIKKDKMFIYKIQEAERGKISRDIHDSVIQDIRAIRIESDMLQVEGENEIRKNKIINIATDCVMKIRNICYNLTPAELATHNDGDSSKVELVSIIQSLVVQFIERTHVPCQLKIDENFQYPVLEKDISQNLFRIIQEALNNIEKHSYATSCQILIKNRIEDEKNYMLIYVSDDGVGCDIKQLLRKKNRMHFGIRNMIDRAALIGAKLDFNSEQGQGFEIKIQLEID